jgi:small subunit ribosomal protein S3e
MESGAKGCEVVVSGKLRAARAKSQKFSDGVLIHSGQPAVEYIDYAVRHVLLRQGVLGIKVKIFKAHDVSDIQPFGLPAHVVPSLKDLDGSKFLQPAHIPTTRDHAPSPTYYNRSQLTVQPTGRAGPSKPLPDQITLVEPKPEAEVTIHSVHKDVQPAAAIPAPAAPAAEVEATA